MLTHFEMWMIAALVVSGIIFLQGELDERRWRREREERQARERASTPAE